MEHLREEVSYAIETQPGMTYSAIDGDGHAIVPPAFYKGRVPERWLSSPSFPKPSSYELCGFNGEDVEGIASLDVHHWVADQVARADPSFRCPGFIGRGKQAQAILDSLDEWVRKSSE